LNGIWLSDGLLEVLCVVHFLIPRFSNSPFD
jgi:hypothetical protein